MQNEEPYVSLIQDERGRVLKVVIDGREHTPAEIKEALASLWAAKEELRIVREDLGVYQTAHRMAERRAMELTRAHDALAKNTTYEADYRRAEYGRTLRWAKAWKGLARKLRGERDEAREEQARFMEIYLDNQTILPNGELGLDARQILEDNVALRTWQEKVCQIIQPAETPDEWGADVADIIGMRERERLALREKAQAVCETAARELSYTDEVLLVSTAALASLRAALGGREGE